MNSSTKRWTYHAIGAFTGIAGLVLLGVIVVSAGPLGYSVGSIIGGGFMFGLLACGLKEVIARRDLAKLAVTRGMQRASNAATAIPATPLLVDATACGFESVDRSGFTAVTSLTEFQALRQRAARRRERERTTRSGA